MIKVIFNKKINSRVQAIFESKAKSKASKIISYIYCIGTNSKDEVNEPNQMPQCHWMPEFPDYVSGSQTGITSRITMLN